MKKIFVVIISVIVAMAIFWLTHTLKFVSWDFRNNLWAPAYLVVHGESAYNIKTMFDNSNSIWFPQVVGAFFFLGFLPQYPATNIWLILNIVLLLTLIGYFFQQPDQVKPKPIYLGVLTLSVFIFPPTIRHLILGQVDILLMMSIIAGIHAIKRRQLALGGFFLALALVKPQHCIVVLPSISAYLLVNKKSWRDTFVLFLATCCFAGLLTAPLWFSDSGWVSDFFVNLQRNPNWAQPNIFSMLYNKFGFSGFIYWLILYAIVLVLNFRIWSNHEPQKAVLWSLALTALISPYLWSWDFVFLLPLFLDTAIRLLSPLARLILFTFYAACFVCSIITLQRENASDVVLWWFPIVLLVGIVASITIDQIWRKKQILLF